LSIKLQFRPTEIKLKDARRGLSLHEIKQPATSYQNYFLAFSISFFKFEEVQHRIRPRAPIKSAFVNTVRGRRG
jgi:hypothetical protein